MDNLQKIRRVLDLRVSDITALSGRTRELSLALTTAQQSRIMLDKCLSLRGVVVLPDPKAAEYAPGLENPTTAEAVIDVCKRVEALMPQIAEARRLTYPRHTGGDDETFFERFYTELAMSVDWLLSEVAVRRAKAAAVAAKKSAEPKKDPEVPASATAETVATTAGV